MKKVLFVCLGNICRSPMAEFYMKRFVEEKGASARYEIASAATSGEEVGSPVHAGTRRKLAEIGISVSGKTARRLTAEDGAHYDFIVVMDGRNLRDARRIVGERAADKVVRLLDFTEDKRDVADPWYTGDFDATFRDVSAGCAALYDFLEGK